MKILFLMSHSGYARNFEWTLRGLAENGHQVYVALDREKGLSGLLERLSKEYPGITVGTTPEITPYQWSGIARGLRMWLDYLRYLSPAFAEAPKLSARAGRRIPPRVVRTMEWAARHLPPIITAIRWLGARTHEGMPVTRSVRDFISSQGPDVAVITPLLEIGSQQPEYQRACRRVGVPVCLPVASWDNLTTKGLIQEPPDLVTVWNGAQVAELEQLHDVPEEVASVTGAVAYDHWFDWEPSRDREAFCAEAGLDPARPFVLYMGSSPFIAPEEAGVALRWVQGIRDAGLSDLQILVRPHPQNPIAGPARRLLEEMANVVVYPKEGTNPMDTASRSDYFDSIHHSAAVMGVNTSALLEASIVDRTVHTMLEPEYRETQKGTLHFHHLLPENGGMLQVAQDTGELARDLAASLDAGGSNAGNRAFVESFIRPHGLSERASARLVASIEELAGGPAPRPVPLLSRVIGAVIGTLIRGSAVGAVYAYEIVRQIRRMAIKVSRRMFRRAQSLRRRVWTGLGLPSPRTRRAQTSLLRQRLDAIAGKDGPVVAGPFLSEVGFELLYWIPFLRWAVRERPDLADRLIIVSRGGTRHWYGDLAASYVDAFDLMSPADVTAGHSGLKTRGKPAEFDLDLVRQAREHCGAAGSGLLHVNLMWEAYHANTRADSWAYSRSIQPESPQGPGVGLDSQFARLAPPAFPGLEAALPDGPFVAVRFYFRPSFPATPENRALARTAIETIAAEVPVVLLNNGMELDEHRDLELDPGAGIWTLHELMTPSNNLLVQSAALARSSAFLGTYGGLSYLSPHYGIDAFGVIEDRDKVHVRHLELANELFAGPGWGLLEVIDTGPPTERVAAELRDRVAGLGTADPGPAIPTSATRSA